MVRYIARRLMLIRYQSQRRWFDVFKLGRYLIDIDPKVLAIWLALYLENYAHGVYTLLWLDAI